MNFKRKTLMLGLVVWTLGLGFGQSNKIIADRPNQQSEYNKILFKDTLSGNTITEIDLGAINPYNGFVPKSNAEMARDGRSIGGGRSEALMPAESHGCVGISFQYNPYDGEGMVIESLRESTVVVLNNSGNEILRLNNLPFDASEPLVSNDGKYLGLYYGGMVYGSAPGEVGFRIYDILSNNMLYEIDANQVAGASVRDGLFVFGVPVDRNHTTYYVFDPLNQKLYFKTLNLREMQLLRRFEKGGAVFSLLPNGERIEKYSEHFNTVAR